MAIEAKKAHRMQVIDNDGNLVGAAADSAEFIKITDGTDTALITASGSQNTLDDNSADIKTSVELIDDTVYTNGVGTPNKGVLVLGTDGTNPQALLTDSDGKLQIAVVVDSVELKDETSDDRASVEPANTTRTTATHVLAIQEIDATGKVSPAGDAVGNAPFVQNTRLNPDYAQVLDELHMDAVAATGAGTAIDVSIYDNITVCIYATSTSTGGVFTFQASHQSAATDALWGTVASKGSSSLSATSQTIDSDGVFIFEIDIKKLKYFRTNLTRTDGTFSVYVWG